MATATKVKLSSEMQYLNERLKDGRAVLQSGFSMKRLGNPDPAFQPRVVHLDIDHVKDLDDIYQARGFLDAVVIFHVADGDRYILVDGFHRHQVYKNAREDAIPAYVIEGTVEDAIEYTALANQHAILKRNSEDIKKQVFLLLGIPRWFAQTDQAIGKHVGVKGNVVQRHRAAYCRDKQVPYPDSYTRSDGRTFIKPVAGGKPRIYREGPGGSLRACINGKRVHLGKDLKSAQRLLDEKLATVERRRAVLINNDFFHGWLPNRGIVLDSSHLYSSKFPGLGQSGYGYGRVVITARLDEPSAIYTAIGRLYALREILERPGDRLVMVCVCYPDDGPEALVEVSRRLGVELLTPEQLVASIKGDGGDEQGPPLPALVGDAGDGPAPAGEVARP